MRLFVLYLSERLRLDIEKSWTGGQLKQEIATRIGVNLAAAEKEDKYLEVTYSGSALHDDWIITDVGIQPGSTFNCNLKQRIKPTLFIECVFNSEVITVYDKIVFWQMTVPELRTLVTQLTGIPVGVYRLTTQDGTELFDRNTLDSYDIEEGQTLRVQTWDGWNDLLCAALNDDTTRVCRHLSTEEEVAKFQGRAMLFIAAHFGLLDLVLSLIRMGVRSHEPVGQHPAREWCKTDVHPDSLKTPVHEASQHGQLNVLRLFVHHNICCVMARDANNLTPLNIALRNKQKQCALYLLTKQWNRISFHNNTIILPISLYAKIRRWCDAAKDKVLLYYGASKSSSKVKKSWTGRTKTSCATVGTPVHVDGFTDSCLNAKQRGHLPRYTEQIRNAEIRAQSGYTDGPYSTHRYIRRLRTPIFVKRFREERQPQYYSQLHVSLPEIPESMRTATDRGYYSDSAPDSPGLKFNQSTPTYDFNNIESPKSVLKKEPRSPTRSARTPRAGTASIISRQSKDSALSLPTISSVTSKSSSLLSIGGDIDAIKTPTLQSYESIVRHSIREEAIECLTVATTFKKKPWLQQVQLAMKFSSNKVKRGLSTTKSCSDIPNNFSHSR